MRKLTYGYDQMRIDAFIVALRLFLVANTPIFLFIQISLLLSVVATLKKSKNREIREVTQHTS